MSATRIAIDETELDADGVIALLTHAVGTEDRDRLDVALLPYRTGSAVLAYARSSRLPVGVIGYSAAPDQTLLLHLATDPHCRQHGIGTALIHWLQSRHPDVPLTAETDADAVRFYEKTGFTSTSLGEKYPGVERFLVRRPPRPATHVDDRHVPNGLDINERTSSTDTSRVLKAAAPQSEAPRPTT